MRQLTQAAKRIENLTRREPRDHGQVTECWSAPQTASDHPDRPTNDCVRSSIGCAPLTAADLLTVHANRQDVRANARLPDGFAKPIDVEVNNEGHGNAGALVRVNVPDVDPSSLRVLSSTRTAGGRVKLVVETKQSDGAWLVAIPRLEHNVDLD